MNRRQTTCLWIVLTLFCPLAYLFVEYLVETNSRISDTRRIVWESDARLGNERTYRIEDTNGSVYVLKTDKAVLTEEYIDEQLKNLQPLSSWQIAALDENKKLREQKARVLKYSIIGFFIVTSFTGLFLYRAKSIRHLPKPVPPLN